MLLIAGAIGACFVVAVAAEVAATAMQRGPCTDCIKAKAASRLRTIRTAKEDDDNASA